MENPQKKDLLEKTKALLNKEVKYTVGEVLVGLIALSTLMQTIYCQANNNLKEQFSENVDEQFKAADEQIKAVIKQSEVSNGRFKTIRACNLIEQLNVDLARNSIDRNQDFLITRIEEYYEYLRQIDKSAQPFVKQDVLDFLIYYNKEYLQILCSDYVSPDKEEIVFGYILSRYDHEIIRPGLMALIVSAHTTKTGSEQVDFCSVAGTIVHETVHAAGYKHPQTLDIETKKYTHCPATSQSNCVEVDDFAHYLGKKMEDKCTKDLLEGE